MILNELFDANKAVDRLLNLIDFTTDGTEANVIRQRLIQKGIKPTLMNIKRHFLKALLMPLDEVPEPERTIILRSGRPERFGIREPNIGVPVGGKRKKAKNAGDDFLRQIYPLLFSAP